MVFANDIDKTKRDIYARNLFAASYLLDDVRNVSGDQVPDVELATASFPCTDLSVAGNRAGLEGSESKLIAEFLRILQEMGGRRPSTVLIENVLGFATSKGGADLARTIAALNVLGYNVDILALDARRFVPQSRPRLFLVAYSAPVISPGIWTESKLRPSWVGDFAVAHPDLVLGPLPLPEPPQQAASTLSDMLEEIHPSDDRWWETDRLEAFLGSLSAINAHRLALLRALGRVGHATAYRRTRGGAAVWEIRNDNISGCLRTARGGSSRQAVVEATANAVRVRWMTAREYARLQGAPDLNLGEASESQAKFALGDAVCVPAIVWLAKNCLRPLVESSLAPPQPRLPTFAERQLVYAS